MPYIDDDMKPIYRPLVAAAALALGLSSALPSAASATTMPRYCAPASGTVYGNGGLAASRPAWAVVRVSVDGRGLVASKRVVWHSSDVAFREAALDAVGKTTFTPNRSALGRPATFDYFMMAGCGTKRSARIFSTLTPHRGLRQPDFHVSAQNNAWTQTTPTR